MDQNKRPLLVIGANGQIGRALMRNLGESALGLTRATVDLSRPAALLSLLEKINPRAVINAAAYTQVDRAEEEEELAYTVNAVAPGIMACWCAEQDVPLVHYSTDYVYSGYGTDPWRENLLPAPKSAYGRTKSSGDIAVATACGKFLILRTSWVYDSDGKNFLNTILRLAQEQEVLRVVADQFGAPSYAPDLGDATLSILAKAQSLAKFPRGIYHLCNSGVTNWHQFATLIISKMRERGRQFKAHTITAITTCDYPTIARRPLNSRLDSTKLEQTFGIQLPSWEDALERCLTNKFGNYP